MPRRGSRRRSRAPRRGRRPGRRPVTSAGIASGSRVQTSRTWPKNASGLAAKRLLGQARRLSHQVQVEADGGSDAVRRGRAPLTRHPARPGWSPSELDAPSSVTCLRSAYGGWHDRSVSWRPPDHRPIAARRGVCDLADRWARLEIKNATIPFRDETDRPMPPVDGPARETPLAQHPARRVTREAHSVIGRRAVSGGRADETPSAWSTRLRAVARAACCLSCVAPVTPRHAGPDVSAAVACVPGTHLAPQPAILPTTPGLLRPAYPPARPTVARSA